jgi:hypothetical protein
MKRAVHIALVGFGIVVIAGCGQDEVTFPEGTTAGGECGAWYPGGGGADAGVDGGAEASPYAVEEGAIFPCAVWDSAMLAGEDTFIDIGHAYLEVEHSQADYKSLVIVISARNCSSCEELTTAIATRKDDFDSAGAFMVSMARRDLQDADAPDFSIEEAYDVVEAEGWPVESWPVTNDQEGYLPREFDSGNPWLVIVSFTDMVVRIRSNLAFYPDEDGVAEMLDYLNGPDFQ